MSGNRKVLLDSNVLIFISKKQVDTEKLLEKYDDFYVSIITFMEVYGYEFENAEESEILYDFFKIVEIIYINREIAERVIGYKQKKTRKIKLPDAIILSTAHQVGSELLSDDWDDFIGIDSEVNIVKVFE